MDTDFPALRLLYDQGFKNRTLFINKTLFTQYIQLVQLSINNNNISPQCVFNYPRDEEVHSIPSFPDTKHF